MTNEMSYVRGRKSTQQIKGKGVKEFSVAVEVFLKL